MAINLCWY